jgi:uncharacterized protein (TIGR02246 family)
MTAPGTVDHQQFEGVRLAISELDANVRRNIQARDADAMVDGYYAEDARVLLPEQGEVQGKGAIREMWRALVAAGMADLVIETDHLYVGGDLAVGTGTVRATVRPAGGRPTIREGRFTVAFRRQSDGTWRNIIDMYTIDSERPAID